jgi:hypothetical protein
MSSQSFDPNKITVADIFRGKEERRRRLAKLPFEEKIEILKRLQTVPTKMAENEKLIFESFLKVCPDFAGESIKEWDTVDEWYVKRALAHPAKPYDERPDVLALTTSGKTIGIELKSWVNREQIAEARKQERIQDNILKVIGEQPPNETQNIGYVWLSANEVRFDSKDAGPFREQLFALLKQVDDNWSKELGLRECSKEESAFVGFPILKKYLLRVQAVPASRERAEINWVDFRPLGGGYSHKAMLDTLSSSLMTHKTDDRYKDLKKHVGLDEVHLLVHYDFKAFAYNTPFDAPNFGFKQAAEFASKVLNGDGGHFDRIFLFHFLWGKEEAYRIF